MVGKYFEIELEPNQAGGKMAGLLATLVDNDSLSCSPDARRRMETGVGQTFLVKIERVIEIPEPDWRNVFDEGVTSMEVRG